MMEDDSDTGSEPCFAHQLVDGHVVDPQTARDVGRFRKSERQRLYQLRKQVPLEKRRSQAAVIAEMLGRELGDVAGRSIAVYWPIRGELDLRFWMEGCCEAGATVALPVVVTRGQPVEFHQWTPDCKMRLGFWNIPVPDNGLDGDSAVTPDIVIVPLLGVDKKRFRLGNGGGYYDRTLANLPGETRAIGVGPQFCMMETIFPMPWDIPMSKVLLSDGAII